MEYRSIPTGRRAITNPHIAYSSPGWRINVVDQCLIRIQRAGADAYDTPVVDMDELILASGRLS